MLWSVTYVWDAGVPACKLMMPRYLGWVFVSTYTVPGAPGKVAQLSPAAPPEARSRDRQSPALLVSAYTATRPPPPAPPEFALPEQPLQPFFAFPPLAVMRPDKTETEPARI